MKCTLLLVGFALCVLPKGAAQVGVNNDTPTQTLDVNGKIKVSDDATAPESGTIRFNDGNGTFEGYDGAEWTSLTNSPTGLPSGAIAVYGRSSSLSPSASSASTITLRAWAGGAFNQVPPGKYLVVTTILPRDNDIGTADDFLNGVLCASSTGTSYGNCIPLAGTTRNFAPLIASLGNPLLVVGPGQYLTAGAGSTSDIINIDVRGFLVDDLDYR